MEKQDETVSINLKNLMIPVTILLVGVMIAGAIFFGLRSSQPSSSNKQATGENQAEVLGEREAPGEGAPPVNQRVTTSIDDDAILGDKTKAKVAIIEFSDFECPFCNRFRTQTLGQIKKDYIDTGKAILVYRDLPLPFHNPAAEREAMAAECAREQGGDQIYYQYHDLIFETSPGNGQGVSLEGLVGLAQTIGLNGEQLKNCIKEEKYKAEVAKDANDAAKVGISGTPGFVVGKLDEDGSVEGIVVSGAQPYSVFKNIIDQELE